MRNKETYYHIISSPLGVTDLPVGTNDSDAVNVSQLNDAIAAIPPTDLTDYLTIEQAENTYQPIGDYALSTDLNGYVNILEVQTITGAKTFSNTLTAQGDITAQSNIYLTGDIFKGSYPFYPVNVNDDRYVRLNPPSQQNGSINISGDISGGRISTGAVRTFLAGSQSDISGFQFTPTVIGTGVPLATAEFRWQPDLDPNNPVFRKNGTGSFKSFLLYNDNATLSGLTLSSALTTASNTTQVLTRNPTTGVIESVNSSSFGSVLTLDSVGTSPNANGATLTSNVLRLQPASVSTPGVVSTATQTFAGAKTFQVFTTMPQLWLNTLGASRVNVIDVQNNSGRDALVWQESVSSGGGAIRLIQPQDGQIRNYSFPTATTGSLAVTSDFGAGKTIEANTSGNSATATKLQTARTINGIAFDGTANITIPSGGSGTVTNVSSANSNITVANPTTTPVLTLASTITSNTTGNAGSATTWGGNTANFAIEAGAIDALVGFETGVAKYVGATRTKAFLNTTLQDVTTADNNANNALRITGNSKLNGGAALEIYYDAGVTTPTASITSYDRTNALFKPLTIQSEYTNFATGNVGIGTTSPTAKLDVNGDIKAKQLFIDNFGSYIPNISTIYNSENNGLVVAPKGGTNNDLQIVNGAGSGVMRIPTGTRNIIFDVNAYVGSNDGTPTAVVRNSDLANYVTGSGANLVGFASGDLQFPVLRQSGTNTIVRLARYDQIPAPISLTTTGSGAATFNPSTGALNIPTPSSLAASSGTYTPTLTNILGATSLLPYECQWSRVDNIVTVSGRLRLAALTINQSAVVGISLPVTSNFTALADANGNGVSIDQGFMGAVVHAVSSSSIVRLGGNEINDTLNHTFSFNFSYTVK